MKKSHLNYFDNSKKGLFLGKVELIPNNAYIIRKGRKKSRQRALSISKGAIQKRFLNALNLLMTITIYYINCLQEVENK